MQASLEEEEGPYHAKPEVSHAPKRDATTMDHQPQWVIKVRHELTNCLGQLFCATAAWKLWTNRQGCLGLGFHE